MRVLLGRDGVEFAPPGVAIAAPLRMERLHRGVRPPQWDSIDHQALAIAVEQVVGVGAAQPLAHRPDVRVDDAAAERVIERPVAQLGERLVAMVWGIARTMASRPTSGRRTPRRDR